MNNMVVTCLDLEGVLVPEIWINFAEKTGIEELKLTTRDIADYSELMNKRLAILAEHKYTIDDIKAVIATIDPVPGAIEFVNWLRERTQLIILSDTFEEFAKPLMKKLGMPTIFCHSLEIDAAGMIQDFKLRIDDHKRRSIEAFRGLNFTTIAAGDSLNDISMIQNADYGMFFRCPDGFDKRFPDIPITQTFEELKAAIESHLEQIAKK